MTVQRRTVRQDVTFEGLGLHSGEAVKAVIRPADDGIHFRTPAGRWKASPENVTETTRCTKLGEVAVIEHLMSALAALEITDAEVEVTGPDLPAIGGCSLGYVEQLVASGIQPLPEAELPSLFKRAFVQEGDVKVAIAKGNGHWRYEFSTGDRWPSLMVYETLDVVSDYASAIAPARTFAFSEELPAIMSAGLAKGLDETSALVLDANGYRSPAHFENEPARHKMLDLIGDLYLAGIPIKKLSVVSERSGHRTNVAAAAKLVELLREC